MDTLGREGNAAGHSMRIIIADAWPTIKCFSPAIRSHDRQQGVGTALIHVFVDIVRFG